jgi:hypothetical protein
MAGLPPQGPHRVVHVLDESGGGAPEHCRHCDRRGGL